MLVSSMPKLCNTKPDPAQLDRWEAQMWEQGYIVIPQALPPDATAH